MLFKASTLLLALAALASAAEAGQAAEAAEAVEAGKSAESAESGGDHWGPGDSESRPRRPPFGVPQVPQAVPELFPVRELQPNSVVVHGLPQDAWDNQCTNPIQNERNYIYEYANGRGQTLLYTFTFSEATRGRRCWLELSVQNPTWNTQPPIVQVDVFTTTTPGICTGRSRATNRNINIGRLDVPTNGIATWSARNTDWLTRKTPCPAPGTVQGFEFAVVHQGNGFSYPQRTGTGVRILYE
ncbi:hypothetical protein QBC44DRAFT_317265 [Cladorrhinum sp. PSN332]|nr:hypothetical protein QBC44DRAFT_317265 [Cladorrhinum sp. PSN332]